MEQNLIVIEIDGIQVRGKVTYLDRADISVEITEPYQGLSAGMHIPNFSLPVRSYTEKDGISDQGKETAESCLRNIYLGCRTFEGSKEQLESVYQKVLRQFDITGAIDDDCYKKSKREFRAKFRRQEISKKDYDQELGVLRKSNSQHQTNCNSVVWAICDEFEKEAGKRISISLIEQLIERYLRKKEKAEEGI